MESYIDELKSTRLAVYTVVTGGYDTLSEPGFTDEDVDYICFTDRIPENYTGKWQFRALDPALALTGARLSRAPKLLPHRFLPEYTWSIYLDGNLRIKGSLREYACRYIKSSPMLCQRHPKRNCVYDEAREVIRLGLDDARVVRKQIHRYQREGLPANTGLIAANVMLRRHGDPAVKALMELWWKSFSEGCRRDQISFPYAVWKTGFSYDLTPLNGYQNEYWSFVEHDGSRHLYKPVSERGLRGLLNRVYSRCYDRIKKRTR